MAAVTTLLALLKLDSSDYDKGLKQAKKDAKSFGGEIKKVGQNITNMGNRMSMATAPIALGLGYAINEARTFDKSMANVNAILGITGAEAADLRGELLAYGGSTRQGPQEVADAFYSIVSGVQDASTHMAILEAAVKTSDAGQAELTATTSALISTMNSYGFAAEDAAHVSDVFTKTVGMGVLTMDDLASAFPSVTGLAAEYGISIDDVGSSLAFMTTQGKTASESATNMRGMITTLLNPTTALQAAIEDLGYSSGQALLESEGLAGSYEALKAYNNGTFSGLITNTEALQGATDLTKVAFDEFNTSFQATIDGSTDAAKAIQDEQAAYDALQSKLGELSIMIGTELTPILIDLLETAIVPAIEGVVAFATANPELFNGLVMVAGAAVIAGPVLSAVGAAITAIGMALSPVGLALALGTGLVLAYTNNWMGFRDFVDGELAPAINNIIKDFQRWHGILLDVKAIVDGLASGDFKIGEVVEAAGNALGGELSVGMPNAVDNAMVNSQNIVTNPNPLEAYGSMVGMTLNPVGSLINLAFPDQNPLNTFTGKADGGGVPAGSRMFQINENGVEGFQSDSGGEVIPLGDPRHQGGGVTINVYQQPGEDGVVLADRINRKLIHAGYARS